METCSPAPGLRPLITGSRWSVELPYSFEWLTGIWPLQDLQFCHQDKEGPPSMPRCWLMLGFRTSSFSLSVSIYLVCLFISLFPIPRFALVFVCNDVTALSLRCFASQFCRSLSSLRVTPALLCIKLYFRLPVLLLASPMTLWCTRPVTPPTVRPV